MTTPARSDENEFRVPHAPSDPARSSRIRALASVGATRDSLLTAAIAVGAVIVVRFAVALVQLVGNAVAFDPASYASGFLQSPIGLFLGSVVLYPFPFYAAAFVALAVIFPVVRSVALPVALARAVAAGAIGTIVLAIVGLGTGIAPALHGSAGVVLALDVVFVPLSAGLLLTALLLSGATLAWLWAGAQEPATVPPTKASAPADPAEPVSAGTDPAESLSARAVAAESVSAGTDPAEPVSAGTDPAESLPPGRLAAEPFGDPAPATGPATAPAAEPVPAAPDWSRFRPPSP